jgi:hypothetical protein
VVRCYVEAHYWLRLAKCWCVGMCLLVVQDGDGGEDEEEEEDKEEQGLKLVEESRSRVMLSSDSKWFARAGRRRVSIHFVLGGTWSAAVRCGVKPLMVVFSRQGVHSLRGRVWLLPLLPEQAIWTCAQGESFFFVFRVPY